MKREDKIIVIIGFIIIFLMTAALARSAESPAAGFNPSTLTLAWDANSPAPEGYRVFQRTVPGAYDRSSPVYDGTALTAKITGLEVGKTYAFVVVAYDGSKTSADSNEVIWTVEDAPEAVVYQQRVKNLQVTVNVNIK